MIRGIQRSVFALCLMAFSATAAMAEDIRLVMVEQVGCHWCERWNEEIGEIYPKTPEGIAAPLMRIDLHEPIPEDLTLSSAPRLTPTFILTRDGTEIARIEGYPGEDFFWGLLGQMLANADALPAGTSATSG